MLHASRGVGNGGVWCGRASWSGSARLELAEKGGGHPLMEQLPLRAQPIKGGAEEGEVIHLCILPPFLWFSASASDVKEGSLGPAPGLPLRAIIAPCRC